MILSIIGIVLSTIAIGLIFWFRKEQLKHNEWFYGEGEAAEHGYNALMKDFTNYQVSEKRLQEKSRAKMEIRHDNIAKSIKKNEDRIHLIKKTLPNKIGEIVSQIEFAQNKINRK